MLSCHRRVAPRGISLGGWAGGLCAAVGLVLLIIGVSMKSEKNSLESQTMKYSSSSDDSSSCSINNIMRNTGTVTCSI